MSKRMVWEPVVAPVEVGAAGDSMGIARPSLLIPRGNRIGIAMTKLSMAGESTYVMNGILPSDIRLCRQVPATDAPVVLDEVREAIQALVAAGEFVKSIGVLATTDGQYGDGETLSIVNEAIARVQVWLGELETK